MIKVPIWCRQDVNDLGISLDGVPRAGFVCGVKKKCLRDPKFQIQIHGDPWIHLGLVKDKAVYTFQIITKTKKQRYFYPIPMFGQDPELIKQMTEIEPGHLKNIRAGRCKILIYNTMEGWNHDNFATTLIRIICDMYNLTAKNFVLLTGNRDDTGFGTINVYHNWWEFHMYFENAQELIIQGRNSQLQKRPNKFICLNRRPHPHRLLLTALLENYRDKGILTCGKEVDNGSLFVFDNSMTRIEEKYTNLKPLISDKFIKSLPFVYEENINAADDNPTVDNNWDKFHNSYLHIVTETFQENGQTFFSEKIFKPIYFQQMFILVGAQHDLKGLQSLGYKTFHPIIDERYDDISSHEERLVAVSKEIDRLINLSDEQWIEMYKECNDIIIHNFFHWLYRQQTIHINLRENLLEALNE